MNSPVCLFCGNISTLHIVPQYLSEQRKDQVFCLYHNTPEEKSSHFDAAILQQALYTTEILAKKM